VDPVSNVFIPCVTSFFHLILPLLGCKFKAAASAVEKVSFAILLKNNKWTSFKCESLLKLREQLGLPPDVHVWATPDKENLKYMHVATENVFSSLKPSTMDGFVYIKVGAVTPPNSPDQLATTNMIDFDVATVRKVLFPSSEIAVLYRDRAIIDTIAWIRENCADQSVAMLLAPPGSGKTRTPFSAAEELNVEYLRVKMSADETISVPEVGFQCVNTLITKHEEVRGQSKEHYKVIFYPLFRALMRMWVSEAQKLHVRQGKTVLLHLDEIQVFLPRSPPSVDAQTSVRDCVLAALADVVNTCVVKQSTMSWLRVIFTGTNFFSPLAIELGSALKFQSINITGSFPVSWVCTDLLDSEFPGFTESFSDESEWFQSQIGYLFQSKMRTTPDQ